MVLTATYLAPPLLVIRNLGQHIRGHDQVIIALESAALVWVGHISDPGDSRGLVVHHPAALLDAAAQHSHWSGRLYGQHAVNGIRPHLRQI